MADQPKRGRDLQRQAGFVWGISGTPMRTLETSEFIASPGWHRTKKNSLWRAFVLSCWERELMRQKFADGDRDEAVQNRLQLSHSAAIYWGELAVKKELEEGWPPEP